MSGRRAHWTSALHATYFDHSMRTIRVLHHHTDEGWWAESPDLGDASLAAGGATLEESREMAEGGVRLALEPEAVTVEHFVPADAVRAPAA